MVKSEKKGAKREKITVMFDEETIEIVETYRKMQTRIPSFSDAVNELLRHNTHMGGNS